MRIAAVDLGLALLVAFAGRTGARIRQGLRRRRCRPAAERGFSGGVKGGGHRHIRYYDWPEETLPGKTLTAGELALIAKAGMALAVIFQHNNDCLCTFMKKGRGTRDAKRALELAKSLSQPGGSAIYFGVDGVDAQFLTLLAETDLPSGELQASKFVQRYVRTYFQEVAAAMKSSAIGLVPMEAASSARPCSTNNWSSCAGWPTPRVGPATSASRRAHGGR